MNDLIDISKLPLISSSSIVGIGIGLLLSLTKLNSSMKIFFALILIGWGFYKVYGMILIEQ